MEGGRRVGGGEGELEGVEEELEWGRRIEGERRVGGVKDSWRGGKRIGGVEGKLEEGELEGGRKVGGGMKRVD